jgi:predicted transcriptional regulator
MAKPSFGGAQHRLDGFDCGKPALNDWLLRHARQAQGSGSARTFVVADADRPPMSKEAVFTMKLEPELRAEFMAEAEATHRPASQIVRELMREFVQRQRQAREYNDFLRGKVANAREQIHAGEYASAEEVEARVAARRAQLLAKEGRSGA